MGEEEFDIMAVPGLLSLDERELLRDVCRSTAGIFGPDIVLVNIGVFHGGSSYCMRAGAPEATLYGADVNGWDAVWGEQSVLNMILLQGDTRETHKDFQGPVHIIFVDGGHSYEIIKADTENWVIPHVVLGGYALFHDAFYEKESNFYEDHLGVEKAVNELLAQNPNWEEQERVDCTRWFRRIG